MLFVFIVGIGASARAQFSAAWLQDEKYWGDGKAEFNFYDAVEMRYGQPRKCEIIHILVREPFAERDIVKAEANTPGGTYPVIKLNQILHIPTGVYVYQQMHSAFWRCDTGELVKATLTTNDSCGNTYKEFRALGGLRGLMNPGWRYEWRTYWEGMSAGEENIGAAKDATFYDELPLRVRMIDFTKLTQETASFAVLLGPTIINSKKNDIRFEPVTISWERLPLPSLDSHSRDLRGNIRVIVRRLTGTDVRDVFILEPKPPHLMLAWHKADGGSLQLRSSLKLDYWNYNRSGDLERALNSTNTDINASKKEDSTKK